MNQNNNTQCDFRQERPGRTSLCGLCLYGGIVTAGTCRRCVSRGQNNEAYAQELFARSKRSHPVGVQRISGCCDRADLPPS
jgi:hypothetical protein